jgi:hypothetical protein
MCGNIDLVAGMWIAGVSPAWVDKFHNMEFHRGNIHVADTATLQKKKPPPYCMLPDL